jgi:hypothetical protein
MRMHLVTLFPAPAPLLPCGDLAVTTAELGERRVT